MRLIVIALLLSSYWVIKYILYIAAAVYVLAATEAYIFVTTKKPNKYLKEINLGSAPFEYPLSSILVAMYKNLVFKLVYAWLSRGEGLSFWLGFLVSMAISYSLLCIGISRSLIAFVSLLMRAAKYDDLCSFLYVSHLLPQTERKIVYAKGAWRLNPDWRQRVYIAVKTTCPKITDEAIFKVTKLADKYLGNSKARKFKFETCLCTLVEPNPNVRETKHRGVYGLAHDKDEYFIRTSLAGANKYNDYNQTRIIEYNDLKPTVLLKHDKVEYAHDAPNLSAYPIIVGAHINGYNRTLVSPAFEGMIEDASAPLNDMHGELIGMGFDNAQANELIKGLSLVYSQQSPTDIFSSALY